MIMDYEREGRAPMELIDWVWQPDDPITDKFGYVDEQKVFGPEQFVWKIVENVSKNGNLLLNISPRADGTIPQEQQDTLLGDRQVAGRERRGDLRDAALDEIRRRPRRRRWRRQRWRALRPGLPAHQRTECGRCNVAGGGLPRHGYTPQDIRFTTKATRSTRL